MGARIRSWRRSPVAIGLLLAIGFGLWELPFASFMADDLIQVGIMERTPVTWLGSLQLYTLSDGNRQHVQLLKDAGALPWFFDPAFKMAFFRPLSSMSLALDHAVFGLHPAGYHVQVLLWFLLLVAGLTQLYGRTFRPVAADAPSAPSDDSTAVLATLLFTVGGANAILCWTATRHIVIAAALGVVALCCHVRWREQGWHPGRWLAVLGMVAALGASEAALGMLVYLFAYEALRAPADAKRWRATLPFLAVLAIYLLTYRLLDLGVSAGSDYLDPFKDPLTYVAQLPGRVVFLLGALLGGGNADLWVLRPDYRPVMITIAAVVTLLGMLLLRVAWTATPEAERRACGWLIVGAALSTIPFAGSPIGSRCLIVPWIGGSIAVAIILVRWWTAVRQRRGLTPRLFGVGCWSLAVIHLVLAPVQRLALPPLLRQAMFRDVANAMADLDGVQPPIAGRRLVLLNAPDLRFGLHAYFFRQLYRLPMPASWRVLSWAPFPHRFHRSAADTLEMELVGGQIHAPHLTNGETVATAGMQATVIAMGTGGPSRVRFRFSSSLDDPDVVLLGWQHGHLQPVAAPAIGASIELPAG